MRRLVCRVAIVCAVAVAPSARAEMLALEEGDHVCIIGGGVADAMQHTAWLETLLHARFPAHRLVIRNLGYDGDELDPAKRLRSADFGTPDQWLAGAAPIPRPQDLTTRDHVRENRFELAGTKADVILAFFGSNEAHAGPAGLESFKKQVAAFIAHTRGQKYNGVSPPRLVMFTPIAHEPVSRPHWPDGKAHNDNLRLYSLAMAEACRAAGVACVDLFTPTLEAYARQAEDLTEDGIHPTGRGDREISRIIDESLFGVHPVRDEKALERLRQAVVDKNFFWFNRYRATDGYSVYGGRAWLKFEPDQQSNYEVGQRELEYLDVKTANRDRRIWATAATLADAAAPLPPVEDVGLPPLLAVKTNKPGRVEGGKHEFLTAADAIGKMTVHAGMRVELVADESRFPELVNPVQMAFDTRGRLWVAAWPMYPHWSPDGPMHDKLLILEDDDGDGRTDRVKTFAGDLHNPTGFEFWGKGVIVAQGPDVLYLEDTDGDDRYDVKRRIIRGLDTADTHHTANSFTLDPAGALYFQEGTFHHSQPETPWGPPVRVANGAVFRYEPRTGRLGLYTSYAFANPHGHAFGRWGEDVVYDGTGANPYWGSVFSTRLEGLDKHANAPSIYPQRTRPCPAVEILSSPHFPAELQGNLLVGNVIGFQGILQYAFKPIRDPATQAFPEAVEVEPIVSSSDPNFRPADIEVGPDGAIYFTDWQNPIIGHMQHNLRDPNRDQAHGRVYRVVMADRPLAKPLPIAGQPPQALLRMLADPTDRVRYRTRIELSGRSEELVPRLEEWAGGLVAADAAQKTPNAEHLRLEALWMLRHFDRVDGRLLEAALTAADDRARAAGLRVLSTVANRVPDAPRMVLSGAADESLRVRLEALRAATYLRQPEAIEALAVVEDLPSDRFMDYVKTEAARVLRPEYDKARQMGWRPAFATAAGRRFFYASLTNEELAREPRSPEVSRAILVRGGFEERLRAEAAEAIARDEGRTVVQVVMDAVHRLDARGSGIDVGMVFELMRLVAARPAAERVALRGDLERLATKARQPMMRRIGYVALLGSDDMERTWTLAAAAPGRMVDLVEALPMVADPAVRSALYARIVPLLDRGLGADAQVPGRFVRIETVGGMRTLWLAEVEAVSGGSNAARSGTARQKQPAAANAAVAAIDGSVETATCTEAGEDPWWEVDLGGTIPLERVVVRQAAGLKKDRLKSLTLVVLDGERRELLRKDFQADDTLVAAVPLETAAVREAAAVRRSAFQALAGVRGREGETFARLTRFIRDGIDRAAAIRAASTIPVAQWPAAEAQPTLDALVGWLRAAPAAERSSDAGLAAWQFAERLTTLLPAAEAKARRAELAALGVRVVRIGTVYERMAYDQETVAVQAGRPVLFVLENADAMPHNFVITKPGTMQQVGELAEAEAQQPAFAKQGFVPRSPHVLAASGLLPPQGTQKVNFQALTEPGVYPYVCTYPGHWRRMFGALYVVADLEAYLADPATYLAAHPLEIKDALLEDRRPRTEWTLTDLEGSLVTLEKGRSYLHGRELFRTASCISCHKMGDTGNAFGPELAALDAKMTPVEIARHILEPSLRIDEKYRSTTIVTDDGRSRTGLVVAETPMELSLVENPVAKAEPVRIPKATIEERATSPASIMPKGLLDKLSRDEVLDLVAYVAARGQESHSLFSPDGCPHHEPQGK
ncbi:MAG: PVC-type heme-binding CxxCH protein [Planctomycetia bacterium]